MPVNSATLALIRESEGLRLEAYADPARGWEVPTVGYGHTSAAGAPTVTRGMRITEAEADAILLRDLEAVAARVNKLVTVPLNANELGALVSFAFNLGTGALAESTLLRKLNDSDRAGAAAQFGKWTYGGPKGAKKVLPGLVTRRKGERALFLTPVGGSISAPVPTPIAIPQPPLAVTPAPWWAKALNWLAGLFR